MRSKELAIILFLLSAMLLFYVVGRLQDMNNAAVAPEASKTAAPHNYTGRLLPPPQPAPADSVAQQAQQQVIQAVQQLVSSHSVNIISGGAISLPVPVYIGSRHQLGTKKLTAQNTLPKAHSRRKLTATQALPQFTGTGPLPPVTGAQLSALVGQRQQSAGTAQTCREVGSKCSSDADCCNKRCSGGYCLKQLRVTHINLSSQQNNFGTRR